MPGKQKDGRTRTSLAIEKDLLEEARAEADRRKEAGEPNASFSAIVAEALAELLKKGVPLALAALTLDFLRHWMAMPAETAVYATLADAWGAGAWVAQGAWDLACWGCGELMAVLVSHVG